MARNGKVYPVIISDAKSETLLPLMRERVVYTDSFRIYNTLDVSEFKYYRINHSGYLQTSLIILVE